MEHGEVTTWEDLIEKFMKKFFPTIKIAKRRQDLILFKQRDRKNLHDAWSIFKRMVKACLHHGITKYVLMEGFYFGLSKDTRQSADSLFIGGILRSSYNQIKAMLDSMANNSQE